MTADIRSSRLESSAIPSRRGEAGAPFAWSLALHGGLALLLLLSAWALRVEVERDEPFVVYGPASEATSAYLDSRIGRAAGNDTVAGPDFVSDITRRLRAEDVRTRREIERSREQRRLEAEREAHAAREIEGRAPGKTAAAENRRQVAARNTSDYETFRRAHAAPGHAENRPQPFTMGPAGRIDVGEVLGAGGAPGKIAPAANSAGAGERSMEAWFRDLTSRLRANHEKPDGLTDLLSAEVQFMVGAMGAISEVRIVRSSGDLAFDRSVLAAFARVRMPARPDGKNDVQRLTFRVRESA